MGTANQIKIPLGRLSKRQLMELDACTRCGECMKWCPVYAVDKRDELIPRNKLGEIKSLLKNQTGLRAKLMSKSRFNKEQVDNLINALYECTACGQCHFVCPARIDTAELWPRAWPREPYFRKCR